MSEVRRQMLAAIDVAQLTEVVRRALASASFQITEWSVRQLSDQGVMNNEGLWLYSGQGHDRQGARPWSVVLKTLLRDEPEPPASDLWSRKRELQLAQSGLTDRLPGTVVAPRFYLTDERPDGPWVWMEHIQDARPGPGKLEDFAFPAVG